MKLDDSRSVPVTGRRRRGRLAISGALLVVVAVALALLSFRGSRDAEGEVRTVFIPTAPPIVTVVDSLRRGQTLAEVLSTHGFSGLDIAHLAAAMREYESPRRLRPGMVLRFAMRPAELPARVSLQLDADRTLHLFPAGEGEAWDARLDSVEVVRDTILIAGVVESNLYDARLSGDVERLAPGETNELIFRLSQIFAWQIDFWRDIRKNDAYRVAVEREVRPDGSIRSAKVLVAEFLNGGRELSAVRFQRGDDEPVEYYDRQGEALRSQFLIAPLDLARITSGFSYRRYHPILKRRQPHLGVDYGAPRGTAVRVTADGVVTRAGWWGGYGRMVEVRHANGIRTRYAHLTSVAKALRASVRVRQGQLIGRVGSTGLAIGSHLHYEFLRNGSQVNPRTLNLPRAEPVAAEHRAEFEGVRDEALLLLGGLPMPSDRIASGGAGRRTRGRTDE